MTLTATHLPLAHSALPPVVLLHGFASSAQEDYVANGFAAALTESGRSVLAIDLPGHGENAAITSADEAATSRVVADILATNTAALGDVEFDLVGYSLGARLAWELPAASGRVRRLVLGGLSPFEPFGAVDPAELRSVLDGGAPANPLVGMMAMMISAPGRDTDSLAQLIPGLASEPFSQELAQPQVPTLFVAGQDDQMTEGVEGLVAALPDATLTRVPGDHRGALDSPEFREATLAFLSA